MVRRRRWQREVLMSRDVWDNEDFDANYDTESMMSDMSMGSRDSLIPSDNDVVDTGSNVGLTQDMLQDMYGVGQFVQYDEEYHDRLFQLRAHIYQGRDLIAEDSNGMSDPYVRVSFGSRSGQTKVVSQNICPTWDEVVIIDSLELVGHVASGIATYYTNVRQLKVDLENDLIELESSLMDEYGDDDHSRRYHQQNGEALLRAKFDRNLEREAMIMRRMLPQLVIELFDHDRRGTHDFIGRTVIPIRDLKIRTKEDPAPAVLDWFDITRHESDAGQLLACFELIPVNDSPMFELPRRTFKREEATKSQVLVTKLPDDIRPEVALQRVDLLAWGLRRLSKYNMLTVGTPSIQFECGGNSVETPKLKGVKHFPNFAGGPNRSAEPCILSFEVFLPVKLYYAPPLNIRVFDNRKFGRKPCVGSYAISNVMEYAKEAVDSSWKGKSTRTGRAVDHNALPGEAPDSTDIQVGGMVRGMSVVGKDMLKTSMKKRRQDATEDDPEYKNRVVDWWTRYYSSKNAVGVTAQMVSQNKYDGNAIAIFTKTLEEEFDLDDGLVTMPIYRGKGDDQTISGVFKGNVLVTEVETDGGVGLAPFRDLPTPKITTCVVRVYVVRGIDLAAKDTNGRSDPYIQIHLGKKRVVNDRKNYIPESLNPTFGRSFDFTVEIPVDPECRVSVWDQDSISSDDLIGETVIDLERRLLSRTNCKWGLPEIYKSGNEPDSWTGPQTPRELLAAYCEKWSLREPVYNDPIPGEINAPSVTVALRGLPLRKFTPAFYYEDRDVQIPAISDELRRLYEANEETTLEFSRGLENAALRALKAAGAAPEHVETRTLRSPLQPELEQGKLQMWIEIFPVRFRCGYSSPPSSFHSPPPSVFD